MSYSKEASVVRRLPAFHGDRLPVRTCILTIAATSLALWAAIFVVAARFSL